MAHAPHRKCSSDCIALETQKLKEMEQQYVVLTDGVLSKTESPFAVMFDFGWQRSEYGYTLPCGIKKYSLRSIQRCLIRTGSKLSIDQFNFDLDLNCFLTKKSCGGRVVMTDISQGTENVPIPCVNEVDGEDIDPQFTYSPSRVAIGDVDLNTGVASGCSCSDNCVSKLNCHCRLLTEEADDLSQVALDSGQFGGYSEKTLTKLYIPGMYECNKSCSCGPRCQNRVSQEGIRAHLQVFRLPAKGWGLRCLHDLPAGYFVCLYSGEVMTNRQADEIAPERGDEYFVSLNLIEMVEQKLGYESDADLSSSSLLPQSEQSDDSLFSSLSEASSGSLTPESGVKRHRSQEEEVSLKRKKKNSSCASSRIEKEGFVKVRRHLAKSMKVEEVRVSDSEDENSEDADPEDGDSDDEGYVIDAKRKGNVGRFLNHSCSPNCQLQNIFTDTHDPRFPVMGFFTSRKVSALEELTWDYLYDESVQVFDCACGSSRCKRNKNTSPVSSDPTHCTN